MYVRAPRSFLGAASTSSEGTQQSVEQGVEMAGAAIGTVFPIAGAVIELAAQIASLFGNTHPIGHDWFIGIPANGGTVFGDNEGCAQCDANTNQIGADMVELLNQIFQSWVAQGAVLSNPPLVIEIRDDGSPGMLFHPQYVASMPQAQQSQYDIPGGLILTNGWNDRDASQYWSLGPPAQVQGMVQNLYQVFASQGWITVPAAAAANPSSNADPTQPTTAQASSGTTVTVPSLTSMLGGSITIGTLSIPVWLLVGAGVLYAFSGKKH